MPPKLPHNRTRIQRWPSASIAIQHSGAIVSAPRVPEARGRGFVTPPLHHHAPRRDLLGDLTTRLDLRSAKLPGLLQTQRGIGAHAPFRWLHIANEVSSNPLKHR